MYPTAQELVAFFKGLDDDELLAKCASGSLVEEAQAIAEKEAHLRGLSPVKFQPVVEESEVYLGDFVIVSRYLTSTEASLNMSYLESLGIPAKVGDANFYRAYPSLFSASLKVPESFLAASEEALAALNRGDFTLQDDFTTDENPYL